MSPDRRWDCLRHQVSVEESVTSFEMQQEEQMKREVEHDLGDAGGVGENLMALLWEQ